MIEKATTTAVQPFRTIHPTFDALVRRIVEVVGKEELAELRRDFHNRLRMTLTQPESSELIEDLWDFFYDWCVFEQKIPDRITNLNEEEVKTWEKSKTGSQRGLFTVTRSSDSGLKLKELYTGKSFVVSRKKAQVDFVGINKGDIIEVRLLSGETEKEGYQFARRPSYHPAEVHPYIKAKVKQFKKTKDFNTYGNWLWLLVGMYLKHRIYQQMPVSKIYDDNSRI
jgi:hypothetical protein